MGAPKTRAWGHAISPEGAHERGGVCATHRQRQVPSVFVLHFWRYTGLRSRNKAHCQRRACAACAQKFAERYGLALVDGAK